MGNCYRFYKDPLYLTNARISNIVNTALPSQTQIHDDKRITTKEGRACLVVGILCLCIHSTLATDLEGPVTVREL